MKVLCRKLPLLLMFVVVATMVAGADIIINENSHPQPGEHSFLFYTTDNINANPAAQPQFATSGTTTKYASKGQAIVFPLAGDASLMIFAQSLSGGTSYANIIFDPGTQGSLSTITVHEMAGRFAHTYTMGAGSNFLILHTVNGESMVSIDFAAAVVQPRGPAPTPEPASLLMLGSGLAVLVWRRSRR